MTAVAAAALVLTLAFGALRTPGDGEADAGTQLPPLAVPEPACAAPAQAEARTRRAREAEVRAQAKIARYPYAPAEGPAALELLLEAARCDALASGAQAGSPQERRASAWRARLERDYRGHFARYRRARVEKNRDATRTELAYLTDVLSGEQSAFAQALRKEQLELEESASKENPP